MFDKFAKWMTENLGTSTAISLASLFIVGWLITGPFFNFSDTWELVVNTVTTVVTFLMVFLLQHTQNKDTLSIQLKWDEIIRATKEAHNELLKIEDLSEEELQKLRCKYLSLAEDVKKGLKNGHDDLGSPSVGTYFTKK